MAAARPMVLLVTDDPERGAVTQRALKRVPAAVVEVATVEEGVASAREHAYAVVLVDLTEGLEEAVELLRAGVATRHSPVLVLAAAESDEGGAETCYRAGAADYLRRPFPPAALQARVRAFIDAVTLRHEAESSARKHALLLDSIGEGVLGLDAAGRIAFANAAAQRLLGCEASTMFGSALHKFLVERRGGRHRAWSGHRIAKALRESGVYRGDQELFRRRDGHEFPVELVATAVPATGDSDVEAVLLFQDITRRRDLESQLVRLASCDPLTGFVNRVQFYANLSDAIERGKRMAARVGVLFIDLDRFKSINDRYGHDMGDQVLLAFGARLRLRFRSADKIGRFGGDEFLVILENVKDARDVDKVGQEVVSLAARPLVVGEQELHVTASVGGALFPEEGVDAPMLVRSADRSMYKAKSTGRNRFVRIETDGAEDAARGVALRGALQRAIEHGELELLYQPRVDIASGDIVGVEALVRWNHPELGQVSPSVFIPLAEDSGLMAPLGEWVMRAACEQARVWRRAGLWTPDMAMGVNISRMQLTDRNWSKTLERVLSESEMDPASLEFDVTESDLMQNVGALLALEGLGERGVSIAIDDFGTGYTSLGQLRRLPVRTLKIDQSLLRHIAVDGSDAAIVSAIVHMGESLNLHVVAEGVEQADQVRFLRRARCRQAQGYHYSRPIAAAATAELLRSGSCAGAGVDVQPVG